MFISCKTIHVWMVLIFLLWPQGMEIRRLREILGFHMTSPRFKLRNYRLFWISEFHDVLQHLDTFIKTKFWFERVLRFVIEDFWISRLWVTRHLAGGREGSYIWVKNITNFGRFCYLNIPCLRINITLILYEFFKRWIRALVAKLKNRCFCWFRRPCLCPFVSIQSFINISHMKYRTDLILGEAFCIFIFFYFLDSGLSVLNGLQFHFWLHDCKNLQ